MQVMFRAATVLFVVPVVGIMVYTSNAQQRVTPTPQPTGSMSDMAAMSNMVTDVSTHEFAPLVQGIYNGEEVLFIHTEASDPDVANLLTDMMGPQVVTVPSLAEVPETILGKVYVFTNGVAGAGPMGYQPDVFDSIPGDPNYTPLRALHLVTWQEVAAPRQLDSVPDIEAAAEVGEVEIEASGVVANLPILVWPGGYR